MPFSISSRPSCSQALCPGFPKPRILWRIPQGLHESSAFKLDTILNDIVVENSEASWNWLFLFPTHCLRFPASGGHRSSLASKVNEAIRQICDHYCTSTTTTDHILILSGGIISSLNVCALNNAEIVQSINQSDVQLFSSVGGRLKYRKLS